MPARVASKNGSGLCAGGVYPRHASSTTRKTANESALSAKTNGMPRAATTSPAIAGPIDRAMLTPIELSAAALGMSGRDTISGTSA
jgi:hypothetical protein